MKELPEERVIDIKQLMLTVLRHWKLLLLLLCAGAVAGGGYAVLQNRRAAAAQSASEGTEADPAVAEAEKQYEAELEGYHEQRTLYEDQILNLREQMNAQQAYFEESLLYRINPYQTISKTDYIHIHPGDTSPETAFSMEQALGIYKSRLEGDTVITEIANRLQTEPAYVREVIEVTNGTPGDWVAVRSIGADAETVKAISEVFLETAQRLPGELSATCGTHSVTANEGEAVAMVDVMVQQRLDILNNSSAALNSQMLTVTNALNNLREPVIPEMVKSIVEVPARKSPVKFLLLGGCGLLLAGIVILMCYYILSGKVLSAEELNRRYQVRALTVLPQTEPTGILRRLSLAGRDGRFFKMNREEQLEIAATNLSVYAPDAHSLLLTGSVEASGLQAVREMLQPILQGVEISCAPDINENAASLQALKAHDHIVLVEQLRASGYDETDREIQTLSEWDKNIIGTIVLA